MRAGVTIMDPATTWIDVDSRWRGRGDPARNPPAGEHGDRVRSPDRPGLRAQGYVGGTGRDRYVRVLRVGRDRPGADVGPFARLRPGTRIGPGAHIGTFVELKNATVGDGTKVPHLTFVGDADIGEQSNIGAATVFVNYDGVAKHHSTVGDHVRIGSDTMLVAPVTSGTAFTAAGSVITEDVPAGALGIARGKQHNSAGWVERRHAGSPSAEAAARARRAAPADDEETQAQ